MRWFVPSAHNLIRELTSSSYQINAGRAIPDTSVATMLEDTISWLLDSKCTATVSFDLVLSDSAGHLDEARFEALQELQIQTVTRSRCDAVIVANVKRLISAPVVDEQPLHILEASIDPSAQPLVRSISISPWDLLEHAETVMPGQKSRLWTQNGAAVDLGLLGASAVETVRTDVDTSAHRPLDAFDEHPYFGQQSHFDSEIPLVREPTWARDFRRSLGRALPGPKTKEDDSEVPNSAKSTIIDLSGEDDARSEGMAATRKTSKRKAADVVVIDGDDTEPAPKRGKGRPKKAR